MRILHVITGLGVGGAEMMLFKLLKEHKSIGIESHVISLSSADPMCERFSKLGIQITELNVGGPRSFSSAWQQGKQCVRLWQPTAIQGWMYHGNLFAWLIAKVAPPDCDLIFGIRQSLGGIFSEKPGTAMAIQSGACLARQARRVVYNSFTSARHHEHIGYPSKRTEVIPNGFDTGLFKPNPEARALWRRRLNISSTDTVVGLVARYHRVKDHETFLKAAGVLKAREESYRFLLLGEGADTCNSVLARIIEEHGLEDKVRLLGCRDDIHDILPALDLAVSSSRAEGFSNTLGEAMSCGVPCLATDVGDSAVLIGNHGMVVPPGDPLAMAHGIHEFNQLPAQERKLLGLHARQSIEEHYSIQTVSGRFIELYQDRSEPRN